MSKHRRDDNIIELKTYFNSVIDWVSSVFNNVLPQMKGLEWKMISIVGLNIISKFKNKLEEK